MTATVELEDEMVVALVDHMMDLNWLRRTRDLIIPDSDVVVASAVPGGVKKPSTNVPSPEVMVWFPVRECCAEIVSVVVAAEVKERRKRDTGKGIRKRARMKLHWNMKKPRLPLLMAVSDESLKKMEYYLMAWPGMARRN
ncbi:hypothetical protein ZIOFF_017672 [Zingiber officinale]|uniref:Uncharacterized protein n=1 Tax=Zingiber officinale TaxID=94328 RepID=A0A8J5HFB8_ZINOF|nr:hypothetical protein ZIOFF_017672 [Zingiber officinale]